MRLVILSCLLLAATLGSLAQPARAEAQSTHTLATAVGEGLGDALAPYLGVMVAVAVGAFDLYAVGLGLDHAIRDGNGLPTSLGIAEIVGAAMHVLVGAPLTAAGLSDDDDAYLAIGVPALVLGGYYFVHGIYSLVDPGSAPDPGRAGATVTLAPSFGGATLEVSGRF